MKIKMIRMSTYPQSYFHIEPPTKLEPIIPILIGVWITSIITYKILVTIEIW